MSVPRWTTAKLADVTKKVGSGATPKGGKNSYSKQGTPLIRSLNIHFDRFRYDGLVYLDDAQARELDNVMVRAEDVLLNITGASIGRVNQCPIDLDGGRVNQHVCIIRPETGLDPAFLRYYLSSPQQQSIIFQIESGVTRQALTKEMILDFDLPIAPLNEQRRIVAKIEELFSDLDAGVAALERIRANLKRYRAAVLKAAVEGKLTQAWRANHPHTEPATKLLERILAERRQKWEETQLAKFAAAGKTPPKGWREKYSEPAAPDTSALPELPSEWTVASLEQLTEATRPICYGILMPKENVTEGVLYVKVKDMKGDRIDLPSLHRTSKEIAEEYSRASLKPGDLLLAIRGTYGRVATVPPELDGGNITQDTARLAITNEMNSEFVATALRSLDCQSYFKRVARGVAVKGVNIGDVKLCPIPIPPLTEQGEIVTQIAEKLSQIEAADAATDHSLKRAARLRQSILKRAFEGKLVPQDPNDEPAGKLLERIRCARETASRSARETASRSARETARRAAENGEERRRRKKK